MSLKWLLSAVVVAPLLLRNTAMRTERSWLAGLVFLLAAITQARGEARYAVIDLGTLGGYGSIAYALSAKGHVVGQSIAADGGQQSFFWTPPGRIGLPDNPSIALDINDSDQVVGYAGSKALLWQPGVSLAYLPTLGGSWNNAYGINESGMVSGSSSTGSGTHHACTWAGESLIDLGTLGGSWSRGFGINNLGHSVGESQTLEGSAHAFVHKNGLMIDLGVAPGYQNSLAYGIHDSGQIVGWSYNVVGGNWAPCWYKQPCLWSGSTVQVLPTLGEPFNEAYAVNAQGQVVGVCRDATGQAHAMIWTEGVQEDLNNLIPADSGWYLTDARDITDSGLIVSIGRSPNGENHGFLLIPEPATLGLLALGGLALLHRKRSPRIPQSTDYPPSPRPAGTTEGRHGLHGTEVAATEMDTQFWHFGFAPSSARGSGGVVEPGRACRFKREGKGELAHSHLP